MLRFLCFTLLASLVSAGVITFKDCGQFYTLKIQLITFWNCFFKIFYSNVGHAEVKSVEVSSCSSSPCTLHKGKDVTLNVHFTASK
jgi:hypothetical protein